MKLMNDQGVKQNFANAQMKSTINHEKAKSWGGIFERLVRSVNKWLKKTIGDATLTYEELLKWKWYWTADLCPTCQVKTLKNPLPHPTSYVGDA